MSEVFPIEVDNRYRVYTAADAQTAFSVPFPWQDDDDIAVFQNAVELANPADYALTGAGEAAGGTLTLVSGAMAGDEITIIGRAVLERLTSIVVNGRFSSRRMDDELDRVRIVHQELDRQARRSLKTALDSDTVLELKPLPQPDTGKLLAWNAAGDGLENGPDGEAFEQAVSEAAASAVAAALSEAAAAASAAAAALSESNAGTSETNAAASAAAAALSEAAAAASAAAAAASEANTGTSETNAAASASVAALAEAAAVASAVAAALSEANAGASETNAAAIAAAAALSEAAAAASAAAAVLSETNAATSEANAAASAATAAGALPPAASQAEAEAGAEADTRLFSPVRVKEAIAALAPAGGGGIVWQPSDNAGASDMAAEINALIGALPAELANVTLAVGTYLINSDIVFTGFDKGTRLDLSGCKFTGTGRLIFDSCKHFNVIGADGRATDLVLRSIWFSTFTRCMFSDIIILDAAGDSFTSVAWVNFLGGMYQRIHKPYPGAGSGYSNEISFYGVAFRGSATQEFTGTKDYALLLEGDTNCQSWKFFGGDFSLYNTGVISRGGSNTSDIELIFDGIYFDNQAPPVGDSLDTIIVVRNCHTAGDYDIDHHIGYASRGNHELRNVTHGKAWLAGSVRNLIPNGDLDPTGNYSSTDSPPGPFSLVSVTQTTGTGAGYHDNYAGLEKNGTLYVPVPYFPFDTAATFQMVARSKSGFGTQDMRMGFGNPTRYRNFTLTESEWSFVTMSPDGIFTAGSSANITIFLNGGGAWGIDIAYIGVFVGVAAPMLP